MTMNETNNRPPQTSLLVRDLQSVLSVSYLAAVGIGMLFNYKKYAAFGINIFEYADVLDFLIAPFSDRIIILFTLFSVICAYGIFKLDVRSEQKYPKFYAKASFGMYKYSWYGTFRMISAVFVFVIYLYLSSDLYGVLKMRQLKKAREMSITLADNDVLTGLVIGKTKEVLFMMNNDKVTAIPISSLKAFDVN